MRLEVLEGDSGGWSGPSEEQGREVPHNGQLQCVPWVSILAWPYGNWGWRGRTGFLVGLDPWVASAGVPFQAPGGVSTGPR